MRRCSFSGGPDDHMLLRATSYYNELGSSRCFEVAFPNSVLINSLRMNGMASLAVDL